MASLKANRSEEIAPWRYNRYRARTSRSLFALLFRLVGAGEFVMTRKTLLGIKQRAERASKQALERTSVTVQ